jgi:carotenoid 1,2-hydratase
MFDLAVPPNGYAWWYVDGISDDGTRSLSVIAFIGSVFSPWYAWSGRRAPDNNVCINVATYGPGGRFTMTDRGRGGTAADAGRRACLAALRPDQRDLGRSGGPRLAMGGARLF